MRRAAVAALVALSLVACGRHNRQSTIGDNTTRMNPAAPPNLDMPSKRIGGAQQVQVRVDLTEYEINMPDTLAAGPESLLITNAGKELHSLAIQGNGVALALRQPLTPGDSTTWNVDLKPGTYNFYCPEDGHKGKGMARSVT